MFGKNGEPMYMNKSQGNFFNNKRIFRKFANFYLNSFFLWLTCIGVADRCPTRTTPRLHSPGDTGRRTASPGSGSEGHTTGWTPELDLEHK